MVRVDSHARGRNEVRLSQKAPRIQTGFSLARFNQRTLTTRMLRQAAVRVPFSVEYSPGSRVPRSRNRSGLRVGERIANRLLEFRRSAALFRSAKEEVGSWASFRDEFAPKSRGVPDHGVNCNRTGTGVDIARSQ